MSEEQNIPEQNSEDQISKSESVNEIPQEESAELPTTNQKLQTEMEVHKHPHHVTHKKKWTEYLLEFLMLFFAVFLGFVAENIREHYVEHQRARQYAELLIADMKRDTAFFNEEDKRLLGLQGRFDTLINLLRQPVPASNALLTDQLFKINYASDAKVITATYNQMKTSGSLRYIINPGLIAGLQEYYEIQLSRCIRTSESTLAFFHEYILPFFIDHVRYGNSHTNDTLKNGNSVIMGRSVDADQRLSNIIEKAQTILMIANHFYVQANKKAGELIEMIKKEYNLQ